MRSPCRLRVTQEVLRATLVLHTCLGQGGHASCVVFLLKIHRVKFMIAFVCAGCPCSTLQKVLTNRTTNQQPTYPIAYQGTLKYHTYYYCMYVIDESSIGHQRHQIEQYIVFGHVPTYALIWRRPYPWMNVGNLCPGVNMKPPPCQGFVHMVGPCILRILVSGAIQL